MARNGRPCAGTPALTKNNEARDAGVGDQEVPDRWEVKGRHQEAPGNADHLQPGGRADLVPGGFANVLL